MNKLLRLKLFSLISNAAQIIEELSLKISFVPKMTFILLALSLFPFSKGFSQAVGFAKQVKFATAQRPIAPVIADLDGDGKNEIIVANWLGNVVSIYRNTSASGAIDATSFAAKLDLGTQSQPIQIAVGDFDADGKPDIAVVNAGTNSNLSFFKNLSTNGNILFGIRKEYYSPYSGFRSLAIADFDGDGLADVGLVSQTNNRLLIYRNISTPGIDISFSDTFTEFTTAAGPYSMVAKDFDGDGKPDIAIANDGVNSMSLFRNNSTASGTFSFEPYVSISSSGTKPQAIVAEDFDGDGKPDIAVLNQTTANVRVFLNISGPGSIHSSSFAPLSNLIVGALPTALSAGDVDGDGKLDLISTNYGGNNISVLRNISSSGSTSFESKSDFAVGDTPWGVAIGDLDGDSKKDIVVANYSDNLDERTISVLKNEDVPLTTPSSTIVFSNITDVKASVAWTDGNGSKRAVFIAATNTGSPTPIANTTYTPNTVFLTGTQIGSSGWYCVYNGTGSSVNITGLSGGTTYRVMVVEYNGIAGSEQYLTVDGTGNPANFITISPAPAITSFSPSSGLVGSSVTITGSNFDNTTANNVVFFDGIQAQITQASTTSLTVTVPRGISHAKISVTNKVNGLVGYHTKPFIVTRIDNTVQHQPPFSFAAGNMPTQIVIGDLDGDGKPDMVIVNTGAGTNYISVFRNNSSPGNFTNQSFDAKFNLTTSNGPSVVTLADVDGDGKQDIIVSHSATNNLYVFRNTANSGSLSSTDFTRVTLPTAAINVTSISTVDLDGDGRTDIVLSSLNSSVRVFQNTSSGIGDVSFAAALTPFPSSIARAIAVGDLNNDGKPDVVIIPTGSAASNFSAYPNTSQHGTISFGTVRSFNLGSTTTLADVVLTDLDSDNRLDVVISSSTNNTASLFCFRNNTSGSTISFSAAVQPPTFANAKALAVADFNGDGKPDIALTFAAHNAVSFYQNIHSSGAFNSNMFTRTHISSGKQPSNLAIADFDGDDKPDLAVTNISTNTVSIIRNGPVLSISAITPVAGNVGSSVTILGDNFNTDAAKNRVYFGAVQATVTSASSTSLTVTVPNGVTHQKISVTDLDLNATAYSSVKFNITYPNGVIKHQPHVEFTAGKTPISPVIADLDGDGKPDMVVANYHGGDISIFRNISNVGAVDQSSFDTKINYSTGGVSYRPVHISTTDLNGDGKLDIIVVDASTNLISIFRNTSSPGNLSFASRYDFSNSTPARNIAFGDLDGDGLPDLVIASNVSGSIRFFKNTSISSGEILFNYANQLNTGTQPYSVGVADLDGDGKMDIAVANRGSNDVYVYKNTSQGSGLMTFSFGFMVATGANPSSLILGDLDGDSKPEIVVANDNSSNVSVFKNNSTPGILNNTSFTAAVNFDVGSVPTHVAMDDLDGDGKKDIVTSNFGSNSISVLKNISTLGVLDGTSFAAKVDYTTGVNPWGVAVGDLDGDGRPEIVAANYHDDASTLTTTDRTLSVFRNGDFPPTTQATDVVFSNTTSTATSIGWTNGNGTRRAVFMAPATSGLSTPAANTTYVANTVFGDGSQLGSSDWYCVYNGTGSSVDITGLTGNTTYRVVVVEYNDTPGYEQYLTTAGTNNPANTTTPISTNAELSNLVVSTGTLSPSFDSATLGYTMSVGNATTSLTVTPTVSESTSTLTVNGNTLASGNASGDISLNVGSNTITTVVTAQDGTTQNTYTITVTRAASANADLASLSLSAGTLSPTFASETTTYTASVPNATSSITVSPNVSQANATVTVNGNTVSSGNASGSISLNVGSNTLTTVVTAQDGTSQKTYTVTVTRAASTNADLASLSLSAGTLSPTFTSATTTYTSSVSPITTSITVTPTVSEANATITVNGSTVASGNASSEISLNTGSNNITIVVTAQDGTTKKTYTLTVARESVLPVTLLTFSAGSTMSGIRLNWLTTAEHNSSHFIIERSTDGKSFANFGKVTAANQSSTRQSYELYDKNPANGVNYYRLTQVDVDGNATDLGVVSAKFDIAEVNAYVYPNPTKELTTVIFPEGYTELELVDVNGKVLKRFSIKRVDTSQSINMFPYASGAYFIRLKGQGVSKIIKFIKM